jgi:hypothetical protein
MARRCGFDGVKTRGQLQFKASILVGHGAVIFIFGADGDVGDRFACFFIFDDP